MEIVVQKYEIEQDGKIYNFSTQGLQGKLRLILEEANVPSPMAYSAVYTLNELKQLSSCFANCSSISEAQNVFENIVINQKVSVEYQGEYIFLKVGIKSENMEEYFSLSLNMYSPNASNNNQTTSTYSYSQMTTQGQFSDPVLASFFQNNQDNGQMFYSTTNETTTQEYAGAPIQSQDNMIYNSMGNNYSYENVQKKKTKKRTVDKLTLSLRPQSEPTSPQSDDNPENSPVYQEKIVETTTTNNVNDEELENLRNENEELNQIILQLKNEIEILTQENQNLKLKESINKTASNGNESQQILLFKEEIEKYLKEINTLRTELNKFDEYKRLKEEEIRTLKIQIEELLINQKKIEDYAREKEKEIDELKAFIDELLQKQKMNESQFQKLRQTKKTEVNKDNQVLTIQDTRLEIIKGDIIQDVKELELLSRKISKNKRKIILNLLYKATIDSDKAEAFHRKCDSAKSTLVLVKSGNDKRFGGFTTRDWRGNSVEKKDNNAFVFSLDKMAIYDIIPGEDAIGCYPKYGPIFLGCQIRIYDEFFTQGGTTFEKGMNYATKEDYELTGGLKKFEVKEIEVYSIELE